MQLARKDGSIAYSFATPYEKGATPIYINVIPKYLCPNDCRFCGRRDALVDRPNIYERKAGTSLYLGRAPKVEEIIRAVKAMAPGMSPEFVGYVPEIAFVGLGEPLSQFDLVCDTIRALRRAGHVGKTRVDTDGLVKCMAAGQWPGCTRAGIDPARELAAANLNEIRISVNETNRSDYELLCRPRFANAFENICSFVKDCISAGIDTSVSFVVNFADEVARTKSAGEYAEFARSCFGLRLEKVIIRDHIAMDPSSDRVGASGADASSASS